VCQGKDDKTQDGCSKGFNEKGVHTIRAILTVETPVISKGGGTFNTRGITTHNRVLLFEMIYGAIKEKQIDATRQKGASSLPVVNESQQIGRVERGQPKEMADKCPG
jgi:hypothetical protein